MKNVTRNQLGKKFLALIAAMLIATCFYLLVTAPAEAAKKPVESPHVKIILNEISLNTVGNVPIMYNSRVLLPLRLTLENMGLKVGWNSATKTASATSADGKTTLNIAINSTKAYVNNKAVKIDTPALENKGRIYLPIRFVGETFGAKITWNNANKSVNIIKSLSSPAIASDITINNQQLKLSANIRGSSSCRFIYIEDYLGHLNKYLPAHYYFSWEIKNNGNYTFKIDGHHVELIPDADYFLLDGEKKNLTSILTKFDGKTYIPLSFSQTVLGGTIIYDKTTKETAITIKNPDFTSAILSSEPTDNLLPEKVEGAQLTNQQLLSISDNPESLTADVVDPNRSSILMQTNIVAEIPSQSHRVFGWHVNKLHKPVRLALVIKNTGTEIITMDTIGITTRTTSNTNYINDVGLPIAKAMLTGNLIDITPSNKNIAPNKSKVIESFSLEHKNLVGFVIDLMLSGANGSNPNYQLKVVLATDNNTNLLQINGEAVDLDLKRAHARGTWEGSEISLELPTYVINSEEISYSISNGDTDNLLNKEASLDPEDESLSNRGHYGILYKIRIPVDNTADSGKTIRFRLCGRGGSYACAVRTPEGVFTTPVIMPKTEVANLYDYTPTAGISYVDLEIVHASASALPVAINMLTTD